MNLPAQTDVHVDRILTNISVAYIQEQSRFIASKVFPVVRVPKQTDKYFIYTKNYWFLDEAQLRADSTEAAGSGYGLTTDTYSADVYAIRKDVGDQVLANADQPLNMFQEAARFVAEKLLLKQEIQWVTDAFATSIWGTDVTGGTNFTQWDDETSSEPINDVGLGKETVLKTTGREPNTLILGYQVYRQLNKHPDLLARSQFTRDVRGGMSTADLAAIFGVERVFVASAIKATNVEGQTATYDFTHGKHALLCYVASGPSLVAPSAGYTFVWDGVSEGMGVNVGIKKYRIETKATTRIEGQMAWDNKVVGSDLGYFFSGCVG